MTKNLRLLEKILNFRNMHCFCCLRPYHPYFSRKYQYFLDTLSAFGRVFTHAGHSKIGHCCEDYKSGAGYWKILDNNAKVIN